MRAKICTELEKLGCAQSHGVTSCDDATSDPT
eukprot:SAG11_NODE_30602_length_299_cov_1.040000_1_plen_31_part_01